MVTKLAIRLDQIEDALAERNVSAVFTDLGEDTNSLHMELGGTAVEILDAVAGPMFIPEDMAEAIFYRGQDFREVTEDFDAVQTAEGFADVVYRLLSE